jgi:hypothetical protein
MPTKKSIALAKVEKRTKAEQPSGSRDGQRPNQVHSRQTTRENKGSPVNFDFLAPGLFEAPASRDNS